MGMFCFVIGMKQSYESDLTSHQFGEHWALSIKSWMLRMENLQLIHQIDSADKLHCVPSVIWRPRSCGDLVMKADLLKHTDTHAALRGRALINCASADVGQRPASCKQLGYWLTLAPTAAGSTYCSLLPESATVTPLKGVPGATQCTSFTQFTSSHCKNGHRAPNGRRSERAERHIQVKIYLKC